MMKYPGKDEILMIERDHSWHPFTQMKDYEKNDPLVIVRGEGIKLFDADGKEYYDTVSSWWTNILGHGRIEIKDAVKAQLDQLDHVLYAGITHPPAASVMKELSGLLDKRLCKYFFSDDGSTAVEVALKMSFQHWHNRGKEGKKRFVKLKNAYHGDTLGAVSVGGVDLFHRIYNPLLFETFIAECPDCSSCKFRTSIFTDDARSTGCGIECFDSLEKIIRSHYKEIAAVIIEPLILAAGGILIYPPEYLNKLFRISKEFEVLVIFDEVATGFGRTGTMFAYQQTEGVPDLICFSKGLTGGYLPMALTATSKDVFDSFVNSDRKKTFFHGHSYTANPLCCSASSAAMKVLQSENLPESNSESMELFHSELMKFKSLEAVSDIRYLGWIGCIDLTSSKSGYKDPLDMNFMYKIYKKGLEKGLILRPLGNSIYWWLPLVTSKEEVIAIMDKSFDTVKDILFTESQNNV